MPDCDSLIPAEDAYPRAVIQFRIHELRHYLAAIGKHLDDAPIQKDIQLQGLAVLEFQRSSLLRDALEKWPVRLVVLGVEAGRPVVDK